MKEPAITGGLTASEQILMWCNRVANLSRVPWILAPIKLTATDKDATWADVTVAKLVVGATGQFTLSIGEGDRYVELKASTVFYGIIHSLFLRMWDRTEMDDTLETDENFEIDVFSELCEYDETAAGRRGIEKRSPVYVQLWEWNFDDIAKEFGWECVNYLGPNGIDAVQVSPVTEHILGSDWYTKYQPIGFGLNSRSGSEAQFAQMIAKCRGAGVQVIVDVILNHIAAPCQAAIEAGGAAVMPCKDTGTRSLDLSGNAVSIIYALTRNLQSPQGWAGSAYGNRRINSQDGWKGPELFHNRQEIDGNRLGNCPVEEPSFTCPQSEPPGDCTRCDFKGLPDALAGYVSVEDLAVNLD
eukprot:s3684_g2.t1